MTTDRLHKNKTEKTYNLLMKRFLGVLLTLLVLYSCASIGRIEGGPVDEDPPVFLKGSPEPFSLHVSKKKITLEFNEYIKLDKPGEKIIISPPQVQQPEIKSNGKKVVINLKDTLKSNTTYTIVFGDAIQDNNEGNPLENFTYTFSTGAVLDTMEVSGTVLNASNLEPVKGLQVGLYANLADSAFTSLSFERIGRTDSRGRFSIRGVAPGKYRIYALQDADQNYYFSQPAEQIAFADSIIIPTMEERMRQDTTWIDSLTVDTIVARRYTHYLPDDVLLRLFKEENIVHRQVKAERLTPEKFTLYFTAPSDTLPLLEGLNFNADDAFVIEDITGRKDTLCYWMKDSLLYKQDSLRVKLSYLFTDSLNQVITRTDTLNIVSRLSYEKKQKQLQEEREKKLKELEKRQKRGRKKKGKGESDGNAQLEDSVPALTLPTEFLSLEVYAPGTMDVFDYITISAKEPFANVNQKAFHLKQKVDTLWHDIPFELEQDSSDIKTYNVFADWKFGEKYALEVDSAALEGLYGLHSEKIKKEIAIKKQEEYGQIFFNISGVDGAAFVELLNSADKVLRTVPVVSGKADFYFLAPGKYAARLIVDTNNNQQWDTGKYAEKLQPEMVYYYPQMLELKANFELIQDWNVNELPLDRQKADELKKQKPDVDKKKRNQNQNNGNRR